LWTWESQARMTTAPTLWWRWRCKRAHWQGDEIQHLLGAAYGNCHE
jgi:hypothetical protein